MNPIIVSTFDAFTALLLVFTVSEILAKVTKAGKEADAEHRRICGQHRIQTIIHRNALKS